MKKTLSILCMLWSLSTLSAYTPLWLRDVSISPNGQEILFCYKGDLFKVPAEGGTAIRLTTQDSYECYPTWSPDSKQIAFASDRMGNFDIFLMDAAGGPAKALTSNSSHEIPWTFTPDGQHVMFSAQIQDPVQSALFPKACMTELYQVPTKGGRTQLVLGTPAEYVSWHPDGNRFLYQDRKGMEDEWRKHHTSSITRDIWMYDVQTKQHTNLTQRAGEDRNAVLSADGKTMYFLREQPGESMNVFAMPLDKSENAKPLTRFKTHPVRFLSIGGDKLCFAYDGEIYIKKGQAQAQKLQIDVLTDDAEQIEKLKVKGGSKSVMTNDGKQIAFVYRGEIFVTDANYATTKQITHTAAAEDCPTFSPDGRTLVYGSERDGLWQLYEAKIVREEEKDFAHATLIDEKPIAKLSGNEMSCPSFSPDGKELAYVENRTKLMVMNLKTYKTRQITDGMTWYNHSSQLHYQWSPDGKWFALLYTANQHDPYHDVGLVSTQGGTITNLTQSGYSSYGCQFVMNGNAILLLSERYGMRSHASWGSQQDLFLVFLNQSSYDKFRLSKEDYELEKEQEKTKAQQAKNAQKEDPKGKKDPAGNTSKDSTREKAIDVELDNIAERVVRLTPNSSDLYHATVSKNGETLYYLCKFEKGIDLWKMDLRTKETKLIGKNAGNGTLVLDKDEKNLFLLGSQLKKGDTKTGVLKPIAVEATLEMNLADERNYMFDHVCLQEEKKFYDIRMHNVNWKAMTQAYRKFLPHINNNYDFAELLSEMLGELNVSHTGGRFSKNNNATASLGILFDWDYSGNGLKVAEIVAGGPFDRKDTHLTPGCIIKMIDGKEPSNQTDFSPLLYKKQGVRTLVSFKCPNGESHDEVIKPISKSAMSGLLYKRWVRQRAEDVRQWSNGRLGYVHIESMGDASFRTIYSDILGKYNRCEGIVIDTRFNGGGRLHEDIEVLFSGKKYLTQVTRGKESCDMPSRRWNKPSIMVTCEANYSNAHGTPWVYQHIGIGKVVGAPVPGTMTSVNWETLQDPSLVFGIPVVGYRKADGTYLENCQLEPDIEVYNKPETVVAGDDTQLRTAVEELLKEIDGK